MFVPYMRKMRRVIVILIFAVMTCSFFSSVPVLAEMPSKRVVRVGYAELPGFIYQDDKGNFTGYAYDLLKEVSNYTNWTYEFIATPYSTINDSFRRGNIDFYIPYQKTPQRAEMFEYSKEPFCSNQASLLTRPDADIYYNDFEHFNGLTIGMSKGTRNGERFKEYLASFGCDVTINDNFLSYNQLEAALNNHQIDAFISASNRGVTNCKIICSLDPTQSYMLAPKGNRSLLDEFDKAFAKVQENTPLLSNQLEEKYRVPSFGAYPSLTRSEAEYIAKKGTVNVMVGPNDIDPNTNSVSSNVKNVLSLISNCTGLKFHTVAVLNTSQMYDAFSNGKADMLFSFNHDYSWADLHNTYITNTYTSFDSVMVRRNISEGEPKTIAVISSSYVEYYINNHRTYKPIECKTYLDAINLVKDGKADLAILNSTSGNYYSTLPQYSSSLLFNTMYDFSDNYCFAVSKNSDNTLVGILNKAIGSISPETMDSVFENQINLHKASLTDYFYENPKGSILVIAIIITGVCALIFISIFLLVTQKKNRQLVIANQAKTDFLSRMSHDMRTPLNGILGLTALMNESRDVDEIHADLSQMKFSGQYLLNLINDTLDVSKIEKGKLELHPVICSGNELLENFLNLIRPNLQAKNITLNTHVSDMRFTTLYIDIGRVEQLFMNIVGNSIKFTPTGGTINFSMENLSCENGILRERVTIGDNGIGMSPEFLPHIFEPFSQENSNANQNKGSGLGMTICKHIVELMNGTISVSSEKGKGTQFVFTLDFPLATKEQLESQSMSNSSLENLDVLKGKRILLCEDHPLNAQIATRLLSKKGMITDHAENGRLGVEKFASSPVGTYCAILMDIRMPVMDGIEASKAIRALNRVDAASVPIIAMTANAFDDDIKSTQDAGMNAHLSKPIDVNELYNVLARLIKKQ